MKRGLLPIVLLIAFFLPIIKANSQSINLSNSGYDILLPEGRVHFPVNEHKLIIKFKDGVSEEQIRQYFKTAGIFDVYYEEWKVPFPDVYRAELKTTLTYQQAIDAIEKSNDVVYVAPVLQYKDMEQSVYNLFYVKVRGTEGLTILRNLANQLGFTIEKEYEKDIYFCRTTKASKGNAFEIAKYLQSLNKFEFAEPDFIYTCKLETNDTYYGNQWGINNSGQYGGTPGADMDVVNAWTISTGNSNIKVAVLDCWGSAAQFTHPDVTFYSTYDATGTGFNSSGYSGDAHGINCAGIISAIGNNSAGTVGVAYNASVIAVKLGTITNSSGSWSSTGTSISGGITWSYQNADVISNSNTFGSSSSLVNTAIANGLTLGRGGLGTLFFSSNGNNGSSTISYPASNTNTVAVAATSMCDQLKSTSSCDGEGWGSQYGTGTDVGAPGVRWHSTDIAGSAGYSTTDYYQYMNGTSSACPAAAAVMALILSVNPALTATDARYLLESTCEKVGGYTYTSGVSGQPNGTWSNELGYGRVNAYNALMAASCTPATNNNCTSATALTIGTSCSYTNGTLCGATQSIAPSSCSGYTASIAADVWYSITPTQPGVVLTVQSGATTDVVLGLYSGSCTTPVLVQCIDATADGGIETFTATGLTPGATYLVRVYDYNGDTYSGTFQICANYCGPTIPTVTPTGPITFCAGQSQTLTISNPCTGCTFNWSNGGTGTTTNISAAGVYTATATNTCGTSVASNAVTINVNPMPTVPVVTPSGPVTICAGQSQVLTVSNQCTGCTYLWSNGATGTTATVSTAGNYTVTSTNSCGTSANSNSVTVNVTPLPTVPVITPSGPVSICSGQSATLTVSNPCTGCTYNWSNSGTGTTQSISIAGNYTVTATNSCGTSVANNSVAVNIDPLPVTPAVTPSGPVAICSGQSATLTVSNPCTGCTFNWSNGGTGTTTNVTSAGNYTVTATNGCGTSTASNSVAVNITPLPVTPVVTPPGPVDICSGQSTTLTVSNPCTGCTFNWSNSGTGTTQSINAAGSYTATATNSCGTSASSNNVTVNVNPLPVTPIVTPSGPVSICSGQPATLTVSNPCTGCTFNWSNAATGTSVSINTPGTYTAAATNNCGTSGSSNAVVVNVTTQPLDPVSITGQNTICAGSSTAFTVNGTLSTGASWQWYTGSCGGTPIGSGTSINAMPTTTTTYYVRAENGACYSGCASITITVNPLPVVNAGTDVTIQVGNSTTIGGSPTASGTGPFSYTWAPATDLNDPTIANPDADPTVTTTYTVTVSDANGCTQTDDIIVTVNTSIPCTDPVVNFTASQTSGNCPLTVDFTDQSVTTGNVTWLWTIYTDGGAPITSTLQNPTGIIYDTAGSYTVELTVTDSCGSTTLTMPGYINVTCPLDIKSTTAATAFNIFPNPTTDIVNVSAAGLANGDYSIAIQNMLGQTIYSRDIKVLSRSIEEQISFSPFANGVYMLQVNGNGVHINKKIEKR